MEITLNELKVLKSVRKTSMYGLDIIDKSKVVAGSFYNTSKALIKKGLLTSKKLTNEHGGNDRKYYAITEQGKQVLEQTLKEISEI